MRSFVIRRAIGRRAAVRRTVYLLSTCLRGVANSVRPLRAPTDARLRRPIRRGRYRDTLRNIAHRHLPPTGHGVAGFPRKHQPEVSAARMCIPSTALWNSTASYHGKYRRSVGSTEGRNSGVCLVNSIQILTGAKVNTEKLALAYMQNRLTNSQRYLVVGLGLPLTVNIRVSRVSAMVSARFSVH